MCQLRWPRGRPTANGAQGTLRLRAGGCATTGLGPERDVKVLDLLINIVVWRSMRAPALRGKDGQARITQGEQAALRTTNVATAPKVLAVDVDGALGAKWRNIHGRRPSPAPRSGAWGGHRSGPP